ncbi:HNH endonuclease signature motif containing protein [Nocardia sp. XZ_19_385]|uniref:HNH endonuclease signature motif containing protein n=1 Tax=Nocardia sp. XZ_19_385 TaxID=2769488 RepID=UPI0018906329|nr:HNH endonuclease signature motif containing protein [Nocardia sp. XZ_19_385]
MRSTSPVVPVQRVTDPLLTAATNLGDTTVTLLSDEAVLEAIRELERARRVLDSFAHKLIVRATEGGLPARTGAGTTKKLLIQTLRISHADAAARIAAAAALGVWHDIPGEDVEPRHPATAAAQAEGEISTDHAREIAKVLKRVPGSITNTDFEAAEHILATAARAVTPEDVTNIGRDILARLDPDGSLTDDTDRQRQRSLRIGKQRADGMSPISGDITPTLRALLDPVLAKLGRPGMNNPDDPDSPSGNIEHIDREVLDAAAKRDTRSAAQRTHDALVALLSPGTDPANLGTHRGLPVSTILSISIEDIENAAGVATTATGGTVPIGEALRLAERALPWLMVFDHAGVPLHLGRTKRLASAGQRLALIAALRGCTRPGCDAPASLCAVHHVTDWNKDGNTDIDNETLACDRCHALVHDGPGGWKTVVLSNDSDYPGRTGWIAPSHIDPTQTPQVNHRHHASELLAETLARIHDHRERDREQRRRWLDDLAPDTPAA